MVTVPFQFALQDSTLTCERLRDMCSKACARCACRFGRSIWGNPFCWLTKQHWRTRVFLETAVPVLVPYDIQYSYSIVLENYAHATPGALDPSLHITDRKASCTVMRVHAAAERGLCQPAVANCLPTEGLNLVQPCRTRGDCEARPALSPKPYRPSSPKTYVPEPESGPNLKP